ncbi:MAG: hypothetical protein ACHQUC_06375 [Chlamydiales bacterium]
MDSPFMSIIVHFRPFMSIFVHKRLHYRSFGTPVFFLYLTQT